MTPDLRKALYSSFASLQPVFVALHLSLPGGFDPWLLLIDGLLGVGVALTARKNVNLEG